MVNYKKRKPIHGFGINDADYVVTVSETIGWDGNKQLTKLVWKCPFYSTWKSMIERCYSKKYLDKKPSYNGCSICEEWKYFSNFKSWMEKQDWEGNRLDKDLLIRGNRVYSPDTCIFVSQQVNSFITESQAARGDHPIGVSLRKSSGKFSASCRDGAGKLKSLGYYETPEEAHQAWLAYKLEVAKELAAKQKDERVSKALLNRYEKYAY